MLLVNARSCHRVAAARLWQGVNSVPVTANRAARRLTTTGRLNTDSRFKILFCGSDEFSVASLRAVHAAEDLWESIHVVVPPEREVGRGGKHHHKAEIYTPALRAFAEEHDLPTSSVPPTGIRTWDPPHPFGQPADSHLLLTASFGHIIPLRLLKLFPNDHRLNVHPSLLPRWRGAAPVQWTIALGDREAGVSVQRLVKYSLGVDAGDLVGVTSGIPVPPDATYDTLLPHLAEIGGNLLVDVLRQLKQGSATFIPQSDDGIIAAPKITHETAQIRWAEQTADQLDRLHRGIHHQYPLWTTINGSQAQILSLRPLQPAEYPSDLVDQQFVKEATAYLVKRGKDRRLHVNCSSGTWLEVFTIQMAGKKALGVKEWWNGLPKGLRDGNCVSFE
ncbi:hypothetical protein IAU60_004525 [Kwoniella sp. DSM 27419]